MWHMHELDLNFKQSCPRTLPTKYQTIHAIRNDRLRSEWHYVAIADVLKM